MDRVLDDQCPQCFVAVPPEELENERMILRVLTTGPAATKAARA
jgi:hypothetical protein